MRCDSPPRNSAGAVLATWAPNTIVFFLLLGIAWLGHLTHWKMPKFEDIASGRFLSHGDHTSHDAEHEAPSPSEIRLTPAQADAASRIQTRPVERRTLDSFVTANGRIVFDATRLAQLSSRAPGIVWRVEKRVGQSVKAGETLAVIDAKDVGDAKAAFLSAAAEYDYRESNRSRLLAAGDGISRKLLLEAEAELARARITRQNAYQSLVNLGLANSQYSEERLAGLPPEERAQRVKTSGLNERIVAEFAGKPLSGNLIPLVAPFDGVLVGRGIVVGEHAAPGRAEMTVADTSKMWIEMNVRKEDAAHVRLGQAVAFTAVGLPAELPATIEWISSELDERTHTLTVRAEIDNPIVRTSGPDEQVQRLLAANTFGAGRIRVRHDGGALVIPSAALHYDGDHVIVFVPDAKATATFATREVCVGVSNDGWTEIVSGLDEGDHVVVEGSQILKAEIAKRRADAGDSPTPVGVPAGGPESDDTPESEPGDA